VCAARVERADRIRRVRAHWRLENRAMIVADQLQERGRSVENLPRDGNFRVLANPEKTTWYFIEYSNKNSEFYDINLYLECRRKPDHGLGRNCQSIIKWSDGVKVEIRFWENGMTPRDRWSELDDIAWNALREWHMRERDG